MAEPEVFDLNYGLEIFGGEHEMLRAIIETFLAEVPHELARLEQAAADRDRELIELFSHRLAGSGGMIAALRFRERARALELAVKNGGPPDPGPMVRELRREYERFAEMIDEYNWDSVEKGGPG